MYLNSWCSKRSLYRNIVKPGHEMYLNLKECDLKCTRTFVKPGHEMYLNGR